MRDNENVPECANPNTANCTTNEDMDQILGTTLKCGPNTEYNCGPDVVSNEMDERDQSNIQHAAKIECRREYLSASIPEARAPSKAPSSSTAAVGNIERG